MFAYEHSCFYFKLHSFNLLNIYIEPCVQKLAQYLGDQL